MKWAAWSHEWAKGAMRRWKNLRFRSPYRKGQQKLVASVYHSIKEGKSFSHGADRCRQDDVGCLSVRACCGRRDCRKDFYITAKNQTLSVGMEAFSILSENGLKMKITLLTAKEKSAR